MKPKQPQNITVLSVVLINILAIFSLRWFTFAGKFGAASVLIWIIAAFLFFIPISFICAEFGAAHPDKEGAITDWVKAELGEGCGFFASWFYFIAQLFFMPTALTFTGIAIGYIISPQLAQNKLFVTIFVIVAFWVTILLTTKSLRIFKNTAEIFCLLGTILPVILLVVATIVSVFFLRNKVPTDFSPAKWIPDFKLSNILFLVGVSSALGGSEISAPFVSRMKNPQRDFPLATIVATSLIIIFYIIGTLSLIAVIPPAGFNTSSGILDVTKLVFSEIHMSFLTNIDFVLIIISMLVGIMLWLASPAKMLIDGNDHRIFPKFMLKRTSDGLPINTIILQGIFITFIILLSDCFSTVDAIYNVFVMAASILLFLAYTFMLIAFIKMKFTSKTKRIFEVPGKKTGAVIAFILALTTCFASIIIPITSMPQGANVFIYELETIGIPVILAFLGFLLYRRKLNNDKFK